MEPNLPAPNSQVVSEMIHSNVSKDLVPFCFRAVNLPYLPIYA